MVGVHGRRLWGQRGRDGLQVRAMTPNADTGGRYGDYQMALVGNPPDLRERDERYTPRAVFESLALTFDLDVCAPVGGVPWIPAARYYTVADDGLAQPWTGRVWMNPPYSRATPWVRRFVDHRHGIALVGHAKSAWHPLLWSAADAVAVPFEYFDFVGGSIFVPVWFAAYGPECVEALHRVGHVRVSHTGRSEP